MSAQHVVPLRHTATPTCVSPLRCSSVHEQGCIKREDCDRPWMRAAEVEALHSAFCPALMRSDRCAARVSDAFLPPSCCDKDRTAVQERSCWHTEHQQVISSPGFSRIHGAVLTSFLFRKGR